MHDCAVANALPLHVISHKLGPCSSAACVASYLMQNQLHTVTILENTVQQLASGCKPFDANSASCDLMHAMQANMHSHVQAHSQAMDLPVPHSVLGVLKYSGKVNTNMTWTNLS